MKPAAKSTALEEIRRKRLRKAFEIARHLAASSRATVKVERPEDYPTKTVDDYDNSYLAWEPGESPAELEAQEYELREARNEIDDYASNSHLSNEEGWYYGD